ncbi:MAG: pentapeptide repeat-containing protein [Candidatus Dormibacteria bacterium]
MVAKRERAGKPTGIFGPRIPDDLAIVSREAFSGELRSAAAVDSALNPTDGHLLVDGARFTRCDFGESRISRVAIGDAALVGCNLANTHWGRAAMTRVEFQDCQMTGFDVNGATLLDVQFCRCKLSLSSFRFLTKAKVLFADCEMDGTDFQGVDLRRCRFHSCRLTGSLFHEACTDGVDLRGSTLDGLQGLGGLRGAVIDRLQQLDLTDALASYAGLVVRDSD